MKKRFQTGGNIHAVPASRQNAEPRTPSGVRPVSSPVTPVQSDVQGVMKHGGEVKSMKKPKKMAKGGMPAPTPGGFGGGRGAYMGPGADPRPPSMGPGGGRLARQPGGRGVDQGSFMGGPGTYVGPGSGATPGMGGVKDQPGMRYPMAPTGSFPTGPQAFSPDGARFAQNVGQLRGGFLGGPGGSEGLGNLGSQGGDGAPMFGGMPMRGPGQISGLSNAMMGMMGAGPRAPAMKKGGKVSASSYNDMTGGAGGGIGRLEKTSIASKTKSQKLKAGGKVKGYADGGLSKADVFAMTGKYGSSSDEETGRREKGLEAYRARQDAAEKRASESAAKKRARKAMETPRNAGGGSRGSAEMKRQSRLGQDLSREMDLENAQDRDLEKNLGAIRRNSENANRADKIREIGRKVAARNSMAQGALSNDAPIPGFDNIISRNSVPFIRDNGGNFSLGAYNKRMADLEAKRKEESGMKRGGMTKMAKGGKAEAFEGTARDMAEDKKLAKKYGMSKKAYEKSPIDAKHDKQQSMKGLKMGGKAKMAMGGYASGGMSTAQDGMKPALRPKPSAMAAGGKVKRMAGGGNSTEGFSYPYDDQAERQTGRENSSKSGTVRQFLDNLDRSVGLLPKEPNYKRDEMGNPFKDRQDPKKSLSGPSRKQSAMTMGENKSQGETGDKHYKGARRMGSYPSGKKAGYKADTYGTLRHMDDARDKEPVNELGMKKGGKASAHEKGCKCMKCGGVAKYAKGGVVGKTFGKPLPGTKVSSKMIRPTVATGASMKKDGMKGQLRAKASGAKPTNMMKPLGMTKMAKGGKVRGAGIAQRGTKFIGEV